MDEPKLRALVIDDSALYRKFVSSVLEEIPEVEVVGTASNGNIGLEKIRSLKPDFVTLDLEMPEKDGLALLRDLSTHGIEVTSIVISALTSEGAKSTNTALQLGAFDFVLKPTGKNPEDSRRQLQNDLRPKIEACLPRLRKQRSTTCRTVSSPAATPSSAVRFVRKSLTAPKRPEIVAIGVSTGGPTALNRVLPNLPADFRCPIVVVQHMPPMFTKSLADDLNRICALNVKEAANGDRVEAGNVFIAPGGCQMKLQRSTKGVEIVVTNDPPERNCRPAVNYLFRSVASIYRERAVAAILTGMGDDGTVGCRAMKEQGALILSQDEATCVVYGMPRSVFEAGLSDHVLPLEEFPASLQSIVNGGELHAKAHS